MLAWMTVMFPLKRRLGAALALGICLQTASLSAATDEERAAARSLAKQGVKAFQDGDFQRAADLLGRAEALIHSPVHLLFMARAEAELGQLVKARELYLKITRETLDASAPKAFTKAQEEAAQELAALSPRISQLTITVKGADPAKVEMTMDSTKVPPVLIGVPMPVDPGKHEITVSAEGAEPVRRTVTLKEGDEESLSVTLRITNPPPGDAPGPADDTREATITDQGGEPSEPNRTLRYVGWGSLGVGAVGLGLAGYFVLDALSTESDADTLASQCGAGCTGEPLARIDTLDQEAADARTAALIAGAAGGALAITGVVLLLVDGSSSAEASTSVRPWLGWSTAGLSGTF